MKWFLAACLCLPVACFSQEVILRERPNSIEKQSIFQPVSVTAPDGIMSIRATGAYSWNMTPIIGMRWTGEKSLLLAIEVVGSNLTPTTAVLVIDGKTFIAQSATWQVDSRGNLAALLEKEGLVRNLATAQEASITVFAPAPVTATFHAADFAVFRSVVKSFDTNRVELASGEAIHSEFMGSSAATVPNGRMKVKVVVKQTTSAAYDWEMNGHVSVKCQWNTCDGYITPAKSGTQQVQGAVIRLLRDDGAIVVAECVSKVNVSDTLRLALDSANSNGGATPTVHRDCRSPSPEMFVDADFRKEKVKLSWQDDFDKHRQSETYVVLGVLRPVISH